MKQSVQNEISHAYRSGSDLGKREWEVLEDASARTGFVAMELRSRSRWWGSREIGAFHYAGTFEGKPAILKIQGIRPNLSEISMIQSFARHNRSRFLRPPHIYASLPWDEGKRYEALVMEDIGRQKVVSTPTSAIEVKRFYKLYRDYRQNCLQKPWVNKPTTTISEGIAEKFEHWEEVSNRLYPDHPLRQKKDGDLIRTSVQVLQAGYTDIEPEFMHGHFSVADLYQVGEKVVLLSNLYWSWRPPFYDAVFGYHWFMYGLQGVNGMTPKEVERQRTLWLTEIKALPQVQIQKGNWLLDLALLERLTAGLLLDGLMMDPESPVSTYLMESARKHILQLIERVRI